MPVYIKINRQDWNLSGVTSKGSIIERKGKSVYLKWGAVVVHGRKYYWAGPNLPQSKVLKFRSIVKAEEYKHERTLRRGNHGYTKQKPGVRIYKNNKLKIRS